jgi:hypothetical protein
MVSKVDAYRRRLREMVAWDGYLLAESGLPGPRGNIELARAVAEEGDRALFERYCRYEAGAAPTNTAEEFLAFCGVMGLGRLLAAGDEGLLPVLRRHAVDPRWRIREAVAMALQRLGDADMGRLIAAMGEWSEGMPLEQRAAAAALCEPRLLQRAEDAVAVLQILDGITVSVEQAAERRSEAFRALRKGLGYCWSVAVVALPEAGKPALEKWIGATDPDIRWVMKENLKKARLARMDAGWVARMQAQMGR